MSLDGDSVSIFGGVHNLDFRDGCNNQIDDLKVGVYVKKLLVYCLQPDSGLTVLIVLF